jgi:hypothetical protein
MTPESQIEVVLLVQRETEASPAASDPQGGAGLLNLVCRPSMDREKRQLTPPRKRLELTARVGDTVYFVVSVREERYSQG